MWRQFKDMYEKGEITLEAYVSRVGALFMLENLEKKKRKAKEKDDAVASSSDSESENENYNIRVMRKIPKKL